MTDIIRQQLLDTVSIVPHNWQPTIAIPIQVSNAVRQKIRGLMGGFAGNYVHINLHASLEKREWGTGNVIVLCHRLRELYPSLAVIVTGSPERIAGDAARINAANIPGVFVLERLDQLELAGVAGDAKVVLTPDTAVTHIAAAMQTPVVTLHYRRNEWYPYDVPHEILYSITEHSITDIPVENVLASITRLLN